jgi:SAM-dependent MidA family methyltransferase
VTLRERIAAEIEEQGPLPFSRYMELCLYEPQLGYYARGSAQFGRVGDFYTSSDVHAVFGRLLARQFEEMWRALGSPVRIDLMELGPGRGLFAQDVLDWSEKKFPDFFAALHYRLVEGSPRLRQRIEQTLARHFASAKCSFLERPLGASQAKGYRNGPRVYHPERARNLGSKDVEPRGRAANASSSRSPALQAPLIVFGNEFFDALPVEVVSAEGVLRIALRDRHFLETWWPASERELEYLDDYSVHPEPGERVEAPLLAQDSAARVARLITRGFFIAIDYGYTRDELLAGRHRGTIMAYRQHSASLNPYEAPGEQDITAHVNFTALAAAIEQNGMRAHRLLTQSQFLMGIGESTEFADVFADCQLPQERAKVALQLKHLVTPAGMGETFQVLVASKGVDMETVSTLSGLRFGQQ